MSLHNSTSIFSLESAYMIGEQSIADDELNFRRAYEGDCFSSFRSLVIHESFHGLLHMIKAAIPESSRIECYNAKCASIKSVHLLITVFYHNDRVNAELWEKYHRSMMIGGFGDAEMIKNCLNLLSEKVVKSTVPTLRWEYTASGYKQTKSVKLAEAKPILPEFYPWIDDVPDFFDRYLASEASILVLLGETGTAKTSLIRSMIWHGRLNTTFTYEEALLETDHMFVDFITNDDSHLLVIEDADLFLTSREHDGNKVMSKFLNVGDGLPAIERKKVIFTANLTDIGKIDNALLRTGRCFDVVVFRKLTFEEARAAAHAAGIPVPVKDREYSLADLFSIARGERDNSAVTGVGFHRSAV